MQTALYFLITASVAVAFLINNAVVWYVMIAVACAAYISIAIISGYFKFALDLFYSELPQYRDGGTGESRTKNNSSDK